MTRHTVVRVLAAAALVAGACAKDSGKDGAQGPQGPAGTSCTVASNGNGTKTISCTDGTSVTVSDGATGTDGVSCTITGTAGARVVSCSDGTSAPIADSTVNFSKLSADEKAALTMTAVITGVSHPASGANKPTISLKVSDQKGNGVAAIPASQMSFALLKLTAGTAGGNDAWAGYLAANQTSQSSSEKATTTGGVFVDHGDGTYAYTLSKDIGNSATAGTTYDAARPHRAVLIMTDSGCSYLGCTSGNAFVPVNAVYDYVPGSPSANVAGQNDKVDPASCLECHGAFRAQARTTKFGFHRGQYYDVRVCATCHNDQKRWNGTTSTAYAEVAPDATTGAWTGTANVVNGEAFLNLPVYIHKIHMGEDLSLTGGTYPGVAKPYEVTYPQDVRSCAKCHRTAAQAGNWSTKPTRRACGACHDGTSFVSPAPTGRTLHAGGAFADDAYCAVCHPATGPANSVIKPVTTVHVPVIAPNPNSIYANTVSGDARTNAGWVPAAGALPSGAARIEWDVKSVAVDATTGAPSITFRVLKDGAAVALNDAGTASELLTGFVGGPSVYFVFGLAQDGVAQPADFNASVNGYLKRIWKGTMTGTSAASISGPDSSKYYTVTFTGSKLVIPTGAVMVTGGIGYTYALNAADPTKDTQPLTQVDLADYPYNSTSKTGGLVVTAANKAKVATGYTARRKIVDSDKCNACHGALGVAPSFHVGQRNDAPTCAFCHNVNTTSGGWAANASTFIHGIHAAEKRSNGFTWHANCPSGSTYDTTAKVCKDNTTSAVVSPTSWFPEVTYPGVPNGCEQCHVAGMYDFSAASSAAAVPNLLWTTAAASSLSAAPSVTGAGAYGVTATDYGAAASYDSTAHAITAAAATTLVTSPVTAACFSCHDSVTDQAHMKANGGAIYEARSSALSKVEQCLLCHGPGTVAAIADVHR